MDLACYIHIPYCIQKCLYCDFTTFTPDKLPAPQVYTKWIKKEIDQRHQALLGRSLKSIYFGGGTPSLIPAEEIKALIKHLNGYFSFNSDIEISIEINPGTITEKSLDIYQEAGVNRFSVGVQTFRDDLLKLFNREHSAQQTRNTLELLAKKQVIFSGDILFALNHQRQEDLQKDLDTLLSYNPQHISAYYLTLPSHHLLQKNRPPEAVQVRMFEQIAKYLEKKGFDHYEISNFARDGFYSKHNLAYWSDESYWGLGISSHSFLKLDKKRVRFWNPKNLKIYETQIQQPSFPFPFSVLPDKQKEVLSLKEALTDFCHTALRTRRGIQEKKLLKTFGSKPSSLVLERLKKLQEKNWIVQKKNSWYLPFSSWLISNYIFEEMTFLGIQSSETRRT